MCLFSFIFVGRFLFGLDTFLVSGFPSPLFVFSLSGLVTLVLMFCWVHFVGCVGDLSIGSLGRGP